MFSFLADLLATTFLGFGAIYPLLLWLSPHKLIHSSKKNNLKLEQLDGMKFNLLNDKWQVSNDKSVNYIAEFKKN